MKTMINKKLCCFNCKNCFCLCIYFLFLHIYIWLLIFFLYICVVVTKNNTNEMYKVLHQIKSVFYSLQGKGWG